uniref:Protein translocase subunit SecA n=1 Tax=uncultured SAR11 cluster bacterium HF0770_37D02 TaxID=710726 RepID=E0XYW7_9PROT|nr:preprotein translocase subunit seca (ATPase, RNA helicase) [uncultured SAR11 cluster bacterium HF0770_37D02]
MLNIGKIISKFVKNSSQRELGRLQLIVKKINEWEPTIKEMSDESFPAKTAEFRSKIQSGIKLEDLIPEAFACVREAARRVLDERHYDVQLMGGIILHQGKIAEMKTGEGKTLVSTLPVYLNALMNKGVHVVTVNDYLAKRDSEWMGQIYNFLGLTVGCITNEMKDEIRKKNYNCSVTYGTNNEFGFDYLRDNMKYNIDHMVQKSHFFCIVDEVDSILIDEARTPLVISGATEDKSDQYFVCNKFIKKLEKSDYELDEKNKNVMLSDKGVDKIEKLSQTYGILKNNNFYDPQNINLVHHINQALRANLLFFKDTDYIVIDNKVQIIDEFTGRVLEGRRFSDGLHQALEAKEKVEIQSENQTLASITYQNYFRLYEKLSGMTGTAITEAEEFYDIYKLKTVSIPTNAPMIRTDLNDQIFRTEKEKYNAIVDKIENCYKNSQPVLVGTTSIEKSEKISLLLKTKKVFHNVLNAKLHEQEAQIIAKAGKLKAVTIATNMAGRGTDIQLGGDQSNLAKEEFSRKKDLVLREKNEVIRKDGLFVIGTERHESRRIDNQLRGRSGRQGDPGKSIFYISLEDDLMRIFGSESIDGIMKKFGLKEGESIDHPWINKALERAQKRVEARNFDIRKTLLKFDDVMNDQRKVIFEQRKEILKSNNVGEIVNSFLEDLIKNFSNDKEVYTRENQLEAFKTKIKPTMGRSIKNDELESIVKLKNEEFENIIRKKFDQFRDKRSKILTKDANLELEKRIFLQTVDFLWRSHLQYLEHLRQVVGLRGYAQKDPLEEFRREAFKLFEGLLNKIKIDFITFLNNLEIVPQQEKEIKSLNTKSKGLENNPKCLLIIRKNEKISRNEKCPATGKKYKHCCGAL